MGDSHSRALLKGYNAWTGDPLPPMTIHPLGSGANLYAPFFANDGETIRFTVPELEKMLANKFERDRIGHEPGVVWGFCMGFHSARFFRADVWKRFAPIGFAGGDRQLVSAGVFRRLVEVELQYIIAFLSSVRATGAPVFVVSAPPPPRRNNSFVNDDTRDVAILVNATFREEVRRLMSENGFPFVLPPPEVSDDEGLLLPEFNADRDFDPHHANADYAVRMLPRIMELIEEQGWMEAARQEPQTAQ